MISRSGDIMGSTLFFIEYTSPQQKRGYLPFLLQSQHHAAQRTFHGDTSSTELPTCCSMRGTDDNRASLVGY